MTDPPPRKPSSPVKWIAIGCGCLVLLLVGVGGIFGFLALRLGKEWEAASRAAESYLRAQPEVQSEFGFVSKMDRTAVNVEIKNRQTECYVKYRLVGDQASGHAEVWLAKQGDHWRAVGARLYRAEKTVPVGTPGEPPPPKKIDDD